MASSNKLTYTVLVKENLPALIEEVNQHLDRGWQPIGGIDWDRMNRCSQAMILTTKTRVEK